ncbi:hypothetical protein CXF65_02810 [Psychrobacter sp. Sarcosine-3u-12]|nr:hypothetical protein CXF65_02810 [Psychrobacter sp. Sarcosine-3u-12]
MVMKILKLKSAMRFGPNADIAHLASNIYNHWSKIASNVGSIGSANNKEGLLTIVLSIQYIGIDASNSKPLIKNNNKTRFFGKKYAQFLLMTGTYPPNCVKLAPF